MDSCKFTSFGLCVRARCFNGTAGSLGNQTTSAFRFVAHDACRPQEIVPYGFLNVCRLQKTRRRVRPVLSFVRVQDSAEKFIFASESGIEAWRRDIECLANHADARCLVSESPEEVDSEVNRRVN